MNRISICTVLFLLTSTAAAQEVLDVSTVDAMSVSSADIARVNAGQCASTRDVFIGVTSPVSADEVDVWYGVNLDCSTVEERDAVDGGCEWIGHVDTTDTTFTVSVQALIAAFENTCTSNENTVTVYALYTTTNENRAAVDDYGTFDVLFDGVVPGVPEITTDNRELSGDSEVTVRWESVDDDLASFEILPGGECGSGSFDPDADAIASAAIASQSTTISPLDDLGLLTEGTDAETMGAVYVVATDPAGNRSPPSEEICISRVPVAGFCEVFTEMGGADCGEAGCSVAAPGSGGSGSPLMFVLLALLWTRRP